MVSKIREKSGFGPCIAFIPLLIYFNCISVPQFSFYDAFPAFFVSRLLPSLIFFLTLLQFSFLGFLTRMTHFIFSSLFIALLILRTPRYKQGYEAGEQSKVLLTFCCVDVYLCQSSYSETTAARRLFLHLICQIGSAGIGAT